MAESSQPINQDLLLPLVTREPVFVECNLPPCLFWRWVHLVGEFRAHVRQAPVERRN